MNIPVTPYRPLARALHWIVALLVLALIPVGVTMTQQGLDRSLQDTLFTFHKHAGLLVLVLVAWRLAYRAIHPAPPLPASMPRWQKGAAHVSHALLYVLLIVMAVSGYVRVAAGGFPIEALDALGMPKLAPRSDTIAETAKTIHGIVRYALVAFIIVHVGAALHHGLVRRDGIFSRMWPGPLQP